MNWFVWRQHRKQFLGLVAIITLYIALVIPTGLHFWHTYQRALAACTPTNTCSQLSRELLSSGLASNINPAQPSGGINLVVLFLMLLPFILGIFVGVPLIAKEYNNKTNLFIWTRSVSRKRWLTTKLVWVLLATILFAGAVAALTTWWSKTGNALYLSRFDTLSFSRQGIVPAAIALFAVSLGIMIGAWVKRTMLAIGITLASLLIVQIVVGAFLRPHYMTPVSKAVITNQFSAGVETTQIPSGAFVTSYKIVNNQGKLLSWSNPPKQCIVPASELSSTPANVRAEAGPVGGGSITSVSGGPVIKGDCLKSLGYHYVINYQPASRYWNFQRIEAGLYLVLSAAVLGVTYWLVLKRDA